MNRIKQLLHDDDSAVSPVIGVILMVAITVILAAVIASFVLGLGDSAQDPAPSASISFDWDDDMNGNVTVTVDTVSEDVDSSNIFLRGQASNTTDNWEDLNGGETFNAGSSITLEGGTDVVESGEDNEGEELRVVFDDGDSSDTLATGEVPASYADA